MSDPALLVGVTVLSPCADHGRQSTASAPKTAIKAATQKRGGLGGLGGLAGFQHLCQDINLALEPFQKRIARAALTGPPELLVLLPRGNGKTTLLAALAVHHLLTTPNPAVYVAASSRDQARILYETARRFAETLQAAELVLRHLEIRVPGGHLRVLAADAPKLHGLTPSLAIIDELHAHRDDELYIAMRTALHKRPGARLITISTAGDGPDSPLGRLRARAQAQPKVTHRGALTDAQGPNLRMLEWAVPQDTPIDNDQAAKKANPASWITPASLRSQREALPPLAYARYHLNQWVGPEGSWLPPGAWQQCVGEPDIPQGSRLWVGVDIGGERSATAIAYVTEHLHAGCVIYHGDHGLHDAIHEIQALARDHQLAEVAYDPWRFSQAAQELHTRGIPVIEYPQTDARMMPASDRLYRAITEQRIVLPDNQELAHHAHQAIARHTRRGWRLDKTRGTDNIDAIIALAMAVDRCEQRTPPTRLLAHL